MLNESQIDTMREIAAVEDMHYANLVIRRNGKDITFQADWILEVVRWYLIAHNLLKQIKITMSITNPDQNKKLKAVLKRVSDMIEERYNDARGRALSHEANTLADIHAYITAFVEGLDAAAE